MSDYISREAALDAIFGQFCASSDETEAALNSAVEDIKSIPAADVRPVVLCRDCKWCHAGYCEKYDDLIPFGCEKKPWADWFCADGAQREES